MELKIESRNVEMTPRWKSEIEERVAGVQEFHPEMTHARVTLSRNSHHRQGDQVAEAHVVLTLPRRHTVTARKEARSFEEAIRSSFAALGQELKKFREKRADVGTRPSRGDELA